MNFYGVTYTRQVLEDGIWKDTAYRDQKIVVIADSLGEAMRKIERCLSVAEREEKDGHNMSKYRAVVHGEVAELEGLVLHEDYDGGDNLHFVSKF